MSDPTISVEVATIRQALAALAMSSQHTDSLHRWKDEEWIKQRAEAINALAALIPKQP